MAMTAKKASECSSEIDGWVAAAALAPWAPLALAADAPEAQGCYAVPSQGMEDWTC
jgi:hypothetical protein